MTYGAFTRQEFASFDDGTKPQRSIPQPALCALALLLTTSVGLFALYAHSPASGMLPKIDLAGALAPKPAAKLAASTHPARVSVGAATHLAATPAVIAPLRRYAALLDPSFTSGIKPVTFAQSAPLRTGFEPLRHHAPDAVAMVAMPKPAPDLSKLVVAQAATPHIATSQDTRTQSTSTTPAASKPIQTAALQQDDDVAPDAPKVVPQLPPVSKLVEDVPMPTPRPRGLLAPVEPEQRAPLTRRIARQTETPAPKPVAPGTPADKPSFFEKMFGRQGPNSALAYAAPDDGGLGIGGAVKSALGRPLAYDRYTAIYEISTHTVHMPDGSRLEAHSGLGSRMDNPGSVAERMRGVTPPNLYDLRPREAMFHGVKALRLTSVDGSVPYGRAGLLAHTFMLGPRGDSNGCVVFRDYKAFLRAYESGQIRRLAVVPRLG